MHFHRFSMLILTLAALLSGCSGAADAHKKVDVSAQIAALKGGTDEKVNALAELGQGGPNSAAAVDSIVLLLKDPEPAIRRLAAYALGEIGPAAKKTVPALKELMGDSDMGVARQAINSLRALEPTEVKDVKVPNVMN
jgi:HEAT repeat protein